MFWGIASNISKILFNTFNLYLGIARIFSQMEVIKFKELLLPGQYLDLSLCYNEAHCKLQFSYRSETTEYSSGRIYFYDRQI